MNVYLDYDPQDGEGDPEVGWTKCIVCQAFTIDPETGTCVHWGKAQELHEDWYGTDDDANAAPARSDAPGGEERAES